MQPTVASLSLALLIAVPAQGGVFAPSLLPSNDPSLVTIDIQGGVIRIVKGKNTKSSCEDNPTWKDQDGDGCAAYAEAIDSGLLSREVACGAANANDILESGDPEGAAINCRATCGTCPSDPNTDMADAALLEEDDLFELESPQIERGAERDSKSSSEVNEAPSNKCMDDPDWIDMDGDGCAAYANAIAENHMTQDQACGRSFVDLGSGNPGEAAKHCLLTCGNCRLEALADDDVEMKEAIRLLVEEESELILQAANMDEPEKEDVPELTTTTTTAVKKLPEQAVSTNATWAVYWAPEEDKESAILSGIDLLKMDPMPSQSGFKPLF